MKQGSNYNEQEGGHGAPRLECCVHWDAEGFPQGVYMGEHVRAVLLTNLLTDLTHLSYWGAHGQTEHLDGRGGALFNT